MEIFDLYNKNNELLDVTMTRGEGNLPGQFHKVVHIWIQRSNGDYLIQQRNKSTDDIPYQWAPTAGAVLKGETPIEAAVRESKEELGLTIKKSELTHINRYFVSHPVANFIIEQWLVNKDVSLNELIIDETEVKQVMYASKAMILKYIKTNRFWDYRQIHENYLNDLEGRHS